MLDWIMLLFNSDSLLVNYEKSLILVDSIEIIKSVSWSFLSTIFCRNSLFSVSYSISEDEIEISFSLSLEFDYVNLFIFSGGVLKLELLTSKFSF